MNRARIDGVRRLGQTLRRIVRDQDEALAIALAAGAEALRDDARRVLGRGAAAGPSAPGEPPRRRSGRLAASVFAQRDTDGLGAAVGTRLDYGTHLEFGTRTVAARPWLLPAFQAAQSNLRARFARAARRALRKSLARRSTGEGGG